MALRIPCDLHSLVLRLRREKLSLSAWLNLPLKRGYFLLRRFKYFVCDISEKLETPFEEQKISCSPAIKENG